MTDKFAYQESLFHEKMLEYAFLSEILQVAWLQRQVVNILRYEVDNAGYDLVLECEGVSRHVQLKSSKSGTKSNSVTVNAKLDAKPGGCVVWLFYDDTSGKLSSYRFFGEKDPEKCPNIGCKLGENTISHKSNPNKRQINKSRFCAGSTDFKELFKILFPKGQ